MVDPASMKPSRPGRLPIWRVIGTLFSFGLLIYLISTQGWNEFLEALQQLPLYVFFIALGFVLLSRLMVTLRWFVLLRFARMPIRFSDCVRLVFMGLFSSNFLPSTIGGDLVRLAGAVQLHLDAGASAASLMVDRLIGMFGMATFLPFGWPAVVGTFGAGRLLSMGGFAPLKRLPGLDWLVKKALRFGSSLWHNLLYWARHPLGLVWGVLFTYGHMFFTFATTGLLLANLGHPVSFWLVGGLWSLSYFVTLLPVTINGMGLQELSIAYLYSNFGGVPMHTSLAVAVLLRLLFLLASLPGALFLSDIIRPKLVSARLPAEAARESKSPPV